MNWSYEYFVSLEVIEFDVRCRWARLEGTEGVMYRGLSQAYECAILYYFSHPPLFTQDPIPSRHCHHPSHISSMQITLGFLLYFETQSFMLASQNQSNMAACTAKCTPCESLDKSHILTNEQIVSELENLKLWRLNDNGHLSFSYVARNFQKAVDSINAIGVIAEREGHHPNIHLTSYRNVEIVLYTHSLGGVTVNDVTLATLIQDVEIDYSPKWKKENLGMRK